MTAHGTQGRDPIDVELEAQARFNQRAGAVIRDVAIILFTVVAVFGGTLLIMDIAAEKATGPDITLQACAFDEVTERDCYWDAANRGNGQGTSYIVLDGTVYVPEGVTE